VDIDVKLFKQQHIRTGQFVHVFSVLTTISKRLKTHWTTKTLCKKTFSCIKLNSNNQ